MEVYGVFEGGGVRGTALVGGVKSAEERGYRFVEVAGTSAGAIVAALLAAGYSADEMYQLLLTSDLASFKDGTFGLNVLRFWKSMGLHPGNAFQKWIRESLSQKILHRKNGNPTFEDLYNTTGVRLSVMATELIDGQLIEFNTDDKHLPVADAVRRSMSIPFFFEPVRAGSQLFVDGGAVSNFPGWVFETRRVESAKADKPVLPILGFRLQPEDSERAEVTDLLSLAIALGGTMAKASLPIQNARIPGLFPIELPTEGVQTTDFEISVDKKRLLYQAGYIAASNYLSARADEIAKPIHLDEEA